MNAAQMQGIGLTGYKSTQLVVSMFRDLIAKESRVTLIGMMITHFIPQVMGCQTVHAIVGGVGGKYKMSGRSFRWVMQILGGMMP